ncbi:helix-turn-helix domain-containing protein [Cohnella fermenti]|uniref:Helix-turn-helix domain-containing protein n=2 Tax=Cohnella fermenti TaxID=2565925 RepID=A0A4S4BS24_9BACL|nr:helix-turn-helix domain-containing protein [Cohnella fermenti]
MESRFPLYSVNSIRSVYLTSSRPAIELMDRNPAVIAVADGEGSLQAANLSFELKTGSLLLLPRSLPVSLTASRNRPLHVYKLTIGIHERSEPPYALIRESEFVANGKIFLLESAPSILSRMEELFRNRLADSEARHLRNQLLLHQILIELLEAREPKPSPGEQPSMERSLAYLESSSSERITRGLLAEMAGVSPSHYSILFKQLTGLSPNDYLSRLRLNRAKELLLGGSGTLREIAQKVGYKDEFYLSRRFKQQTGASPSGYNGGSIGRIAVLLAPYASHLMLLGVEPTVLLSETNEYVNAEDVQPPRSMKFVNVGSEIEQIRAALVQNGIELIIAADEHLRELGLRAEQLRVVAPVMRISWMELGWREHLRLIASLLRRSDAAEQWLEEFSEEERVARELVHRGELAKEAVTIFVIKPEQLLVYGGRNVGCIIYHSLGLTPPERIRQELEERGDRFHSVPIRISDLPLYAGDRILVIVWPDAAGSTAHSGNVFGSAEWKELPAVKNGRVHELEMDDWVPYNPVSIRLQLRRAVALFTGENIGNQ